MILIVLTAALLLKSFRIEGRHLKNVPQFFSKVMPCIVFEGLQFYPRIYVKSPTLRGDRKHFDVFRHFLASFVFIFDKFFADNQPNKIESINVTTNW